MCTRGAERTCYTAPMLRSRVFVSDRIFFFFKTILINLFFESANARVWYRIKYMIYYIIINSVCAQSVGGDIPFAWP